MRNVRGLLWVLRVSSSNTVNEALRVEQLMLDIQLVDA